MSSAMNHRWRKLLNTPTPELHTYGDGSKAAWCDYECTWAKCHGRQVVAQIGYDYITGRAGRITDAQKVVCQEHLDRWLKKHPTAREAKPAGYEWHQNNF